MVADNDGNDHTAAAADDDDDDDGDDDDVVDDDDEDEGSPARLEHLGVHVQTMTTGPTLLQSTRPQPYTPKQYLSKLS